MINAVEDKLVVRDGLGTLVSGMIGKFVADLEDNEGAIRFANCPVRSARWRHIDVRRDNLPEKVAEREIISMPTSSPSRWQDRCLDDTDMFMNMVSNTLRLLLVVLWSTGKDFYCIA